MKTNRFTVELLLYMLAVLIAVYLRGAALGLAPLANSEAELALEALDLARGARVSIGVEPGYVLSTGFIFFFLGSSSVLARVVPVIAGSLLVLVPYFSREWIGRLPAIILAIGLALDPGFVALSRQVNGTILAVSFSVLAVVFVLKKRAIPAGIFAGLALLSGPTFFTGLVGGVVTYVLGRAFGLGGLDERAFGSDEDQDEPRLSLNLRVMLLSGGGTILLAGTLFFRFPQGIGGLAAALPAYFETWFVSSGVSIGRQLGALISYHPWAVLFGLIGTVSAWINNNRVGRWMSLWLIVGLVLALAPLGRQVQDLVWPLIPLWILAAIWFARQFVWAEEEGFTILGLAVLVFLFLLYAGLNLTAIARMPLDPQAVRLRWQLIGGALGLVGVSTILIALGWSGLVARLGLVWGGTLILGLFTLASTWWVLDRNGNRAQELWYDQPSTVHEGILMETIRDLSEWSTGRRDGVEIVVDVDLPSVYWVLRNFPNLSDGSRLDGIYFPPLVITEQFAEPRLDENYRGTDFLWQELPAWPGSLPENFLRWLFFRESPTDQDKIILWARNDLFPDGALLQSDFQGVSE